MTTTAVLPQPPPGFYVDTQGQRTLSPNVSVQWRDGDFRLVAERDVPKGCVLWEEAAVLAFGKDPACPLNYLQGSATSPVSDATTLHRRLRALPQLMKTLKLKGSPLESMPESFSLQICFLAHCFEAGTTGPGAWSWLRWCPWNDIGRHMYPDAEEDARTATTFAAAVHKALPEELRPRVPLVDLVRLWFMGSRAAVPVGGPDAGAYAVYHYLSVARRMRCLDVVNCDVQLQRGEGGLAEEGGPPAQNPIRIRAMASRAVLRGQEVTVGMYPVDIGPLPSDVVAPSSDAGVAPPTGPLIGGRYDPATFKAMMMRGAQAHAARGGAFPPPTQ